MKSSLLLLCLVMTARTLLAQNTSNPVARFHTDLGDIDVVLLRDSAPKTVANFLNYVNPGKYDNTFIHRSVPNFVIQGGGYRFVNNQTELVPADAPVMNEFKVSNTRGTLAMAKLGGDPNSATSQWFFNQSDSNAPNLDNQNGGFTVFGRILGSSGLSVMDAIGVLPIYNFGSPFDSLPLRNYSGGNVQDSNLVHVISIKPAGQFGIRSITYLAPNTMRLQCLGFPSAVHRIEFSTDLSFTSFALRTADAFGAFQYDDVSAGTKKFYRIASP